MSGTKKGPAYCRFDISSGSVGEGIQAGILIRQLDGNGGKQPGPSFALQRIVRGYFGRHKWTDDELGLIGRIHGKRIDGRNGSPLILKRRATLLPRELAKGTRFNVPENRDRNFEGFSIRDAALRVSIWRKYSGDERIADDKRRALT